MTEPSHHRMIQEPQKILHILKRRSSSCLRVDARGDSGTPPGCLPFFPELRGSARRARTPGYLLATLRVAGACAPRRTRPVDPGTSRTSLHTAPSSRGTAVELASRVSQSSVFVKGMFLRRAP